MSHTRRNLSLASIGGLLERAYDEAQRTGMTVVNTGHLILAAQRLTASLFGGLLRDRGADAAVLATHVERLARMDEGPGDDPALTARAEAVLAQSAARLPEAPTVERVADVAVWHVLGEPQTVGFRALDNAGHEPAVLRGRLERALGLDGPADSAPSGATAPITGAAYRLTPAQYAAMSLDGDYKTAAQKKPFHAEVRGGDLHIFSGWRFQKKAYDGDGNSIYFDAERLIRESVEFVRRQGEVELGSCAENRVPAPDTFEAFLRQFSISGNLASYVPAILEHLGAIRIEKRKGGVHWAVPGDRVDDRDA